MSVQCRLQSYGSRRQKAVGGYACYLQDRRGRVDRMVRITRLSVSVAELMEYPRNCTGAKLASGTTTPSGWVHVRTVA